MTASKDPELFSRVSTLEANVESLANDIRAVNRNLDTYAKATQTQFQQIESKLIDSLKTPWSTLASWAAVIVAFISVAAAPFAWGLIEMHKTQKEHIELDGHPSTVQSLNYINQKINNLSLKVEEESELLGKTININTKQEEWIRLREKEESFKATQGH